MSEDAKKQADVEVKEDVKASAKAPAKPADKPAAKPAAKADKPAAKPAAKADKPAAKPAAKADKPEEHKARIKPELDDETRDALGLRKDKDGRRPAFRRQEWWRYKKLGGKNAPWRRPRGTHSKMRRHYSYRPPVVSIGYRGPAAVRGLHPSGFEEVLVHRPDDLDAVDPKTQAGRIGRTVGGRKAELITKEADKRGIRILNRRD